MVVAAAGGPASGGELSVFQHVFIGSTTLKRSERQTHGLMR